MRAPFSPAQWRSPSLFTLSLRVPLLSFCRVHRWVHVFVQIAIVQFAVFRVGALPGSGRSAARSLVSTRARVRLLCNSRQHAGPDELPFCPGQCARFPFPFPPLARRTPAGAGVRASARAPRGEGWARDASSAAPARLRSHPPPPLAFVAVCPGAAIGLGFAFVSLCRSLCGLPRPSAQCLHHSPAVRSGGTWCVGMLVRGIGASVLLLPLPALIQKKKNTSTSMAFCNVKT